MYLDIVKKEKAWSPHLSSIALEYEKVIVPTLQPSGCICQRINNLCPFLNIALINSHDGHDGLIWET